MINYLHLIGAMLTGAVLCGILGIINDQFDRSWKGSLVLGALLGLGLYLLSV